MPGQLHTAKMSGLWRRGNRLMVKVSKTFIKENHVSHLSVFWGSLIWRGLYRKYSCFTFEKGVCKCHCERLVKQASMEWCWWFIYSLDF